MFHLIIEVSINYGYYYVALITELFGSLLTNPGLFPWMVPYLLGGVKAKRTKL